MRKRRVAPAGPAGPIALFFTCDELVFAFDSALVDRIVLIDEVEVIAEPNSDLPESGIVALDGRRLPAWDLAGLLTGGTSRDAWITLRDRDGVGSFALRTGRCACVRALPERVALPPNLTRPLGGAVRGAFRIESIPELLGYPCGYELEPSALLGERERAQVAALRARGALA